MARTKATVGAKISSGKSSKARCSVGPPVSNGTSGSSDKSSRGAGGGNPVCPRETPKWQKPITNFFINKNNDSRESEGDGEAAGSSKSKPKKHNVIESSDEGTPEKSKNNEKSKNHSNLNNVNPKNHELDETIELEPLTGENSHKIQEYYPKGAKVKSAGKKKGTKHVKKNESEGDTTAQANGKLQIFNGKSNDSTDKKKTAKGKGVGKKTKETKHVEVNEEEAHNEADLSESSNDETISKSIGKENVNSNIESDKSSNNGRKKREREDGIEEENINKKIKVN